MLIQAGISEFAVQTFNKGILRWFTWLNKIQSDSIFFAPEKHRFAGKFSTVVTGDACRLTVSAQPPTRYP